MIIKEASNLQNPKYKSLYRQLTLKLHPDNKKTGNAKLMAELNNSAERGDYYFRAFLQKLEEKGIVEKLGVPKKDEELKSKIDSLNKEVKEKREQASNEVSRMLEYKLFESLVRQFALIYGKNNGLTITLQNPFFHNAKLIFNLTIKKTKMFKTKEGTYTFSELDNFLDEKENIYLLARIFVEKSIERFKKEYGD